MIRFIKRLKTLKTAACGRWETGDGGGMGVGVVFGI